MLNAAKSSSVNTNIIQAAILHFWVWQLYGYYGAPFVSKFNCMTGISSIRCHTGIYEYLFQDAYTAQLEIPL